MPRAYAMLRYASAFITTRESYAVRRGERAPRRTAQERSKDGSAQALQGSALR